jgi:alkyl hydroperoxide reductase subunit AhpC
MPARLVIDPNGVVRHTAINADYTVRPEPEETLEVLKALG